jgi:hypothetical protein
MGSAAIEESVLMLATAYAASAISLWARHRLSLRSPILAGLAIVELFLMMV